MYQQTGLLFYRLRYVLASILTLAFLLLIAALVTRIGPPSLSDNPVNTNIYDTPNVVTASAYILLDDTKQVMLSTDIALYKTCRSITRITVQSGREAAHGSAVIGNGTWNVATLMGRVIGDVLMLSVHLAGSGIIFTVRLPGKIMGSVTREPEVSAILRPADYQTVPLISQETSAAVLANLSIKKQQEIVKLQAAQLVANQSLDGVVVAGDPNHGGYPARWDAPVPQDSLLDSWGMYNRECVSYTAWKVYQTYGYMPYWGGIGNANQWVGDAQAAGIPTGSTPQVHSVAISMRGYYAHAMWVEAVSGKMIYVSQYNYKLDGQYSEMWVNGNSFTYIYFK